MIYIHIYLVSNIQHVYISNLNVFVVSQILYKCSCISVCNAWVSQYLMEVQIIHFLLVLSFLSLLSALLKISFKYLSINIGVVGAFLKTNKIGNIYRVRGSNCRVLWYLIVYKDSFRAKYGAPNMKSFSSNF